MPITLSSNIHAILGSLRSVPVPAKPGEAILPPPPVIPFITISREVGAGGWTLAQMLVDALNASDPGEQQWTCWDRELVEKVAGDFKLSTRLIESLDTRQHSWLTDFFSSLSFAGGPDSADELQVFRKVAATVRALAQTGRVVLVGRGGMFLTRHMPGGIHIRLVAPLQQRIGNVARLMGYTQTMAANYVRDTTRARDAFFKRYWPNEHLTPETFALTINTATVSPEACVQIITDVLKDAKKPRASMSAMSSTQPSSVPSQAASRHTSAEAL